MVRLALILMLLCGRPETFAQTQLLPEGIGLYQFGQRQYSPLQSYYDGSGSQRPMGQKLSSHLAGDHLRSGRSGADLKRLSTELERYEASNGSLADDLDLGRVSGTIDANINARIFGVAYGVSRRLTLFVGAPYISASVSASMAHGGNNNAAAIRDELGDLAYDELAAGLLQASAISTTSLYEQINAKGYQSIDKWEHSGFGDLRLGAKTGWNQSLGKGHQGGATLTSEVILPTGYVEQPDILTDVSFGTGYYSLAFSLEESLLLSRHLILGADSRLQLNLPHKRQMRVPEAQESMVEADRQVEVEHIPGQDLAVAAKAGWDFGLVDAVYRHGYEHHQQDEFRGSLEGNYLAMADETEVSKHFHEVSLKLDTVKAYQRKVFMVPLHLSLSHRRLISGVNTPAEEYYELSLASFFQGHQARKKRRHKRRSH